MQGGNNSASIFGQPYPGYLLDNRDRKNPHYEDEYSKIIPETVYPSTANFSNPKKWWEK